ncbi:phospholipid phosphatase 1-like [Hyposmocoma kahamanoa]|uniref:phospholipid phosphatase 1-like n=1 Tax=Hyposmocoma kahamanoa TaxID=1477025 RepID=UPI000E6D641F|nr:phospholipid phosphatase 1-like [Hyposmocoma kahamanoa]
MDKILDKAKFLWSKTNRFHRVILIFLLVELRFIPGGQFGFRCNDPALSYQFNGDTISWKWLMVVTILLPLVVMLLTERKYHNVDKQRPKNRALRWYKEYMYGFVLNLTVVQVLKLIVGSPRPHFFDTCMPKEATTCQDSDYVSSYTCTKAHWMNQSDRSFPSGHTSLALHAALFIVYYLHRRSKPHTRAIRAIQTGCMASAVYCALSRMSDHRHHWWDVLAGTMIGFISLYYTTKLCKNFECRNTKAADKEKTLEKEQASEMNNVNGGGDGPSIPILETVDT